MYIKLFRHTHIPIQMSLVYVTGKKRQCVNVFLLTTKRHTSAGRALNCCNMHQFLYCTISIEKAVKLNVANTIR